VHFKPRGDDFGVVDWPLGRRLTGIAGWRASGWQRPAVPVSR